VIDLTRVIELPAAPPAVWSILWDFTKLSPCIPGCGDVQEVEPQRRYRATVRERVGPFKVEVPLEILVEALETGSRLAVKASGRDSVLSSPVKLSMTVTLVAHNTGTKLTLQGKAEVGGKLAALGQGVIHRKTRDILNEFAVNLDRLLKGQADAPAV
jgi:uncharacterized protein